MRFLEYIKKLILSDSRESSKRFLMLYSMLLCTFVVTFSTNPSNATAVLSMLLGFTLTLAGVASWQNVKKHKKDENE
jgi:uncharacterized membrane protein HdeD (DUF308 family)